MISALPRPRRSLRSVVVGVIEHPPIAVAVAVALFHLALLPPVIGSIDERSMAAVAESLVEGRGFEVPCGLGVPGQGGCYSPWYPLLSILAMPVVAVAKGLAGFAGVDEQRLIGATVIVVPALCAAGAAGFCVALAQRLGAAPRAAALAGLAFALGTEALVYARAFYVETLGALLAAMALWALTGPATPRRRRLAFWSLFLLPLAKPPLVLLGPAFGLALAIHARDREPFKRCSLASAAGLGAYALLNGARFGNPFNFGGASRRLEGDDLSPMNLVEALGLFTISPGRGILIYSAAAVVGGVALVRHRPREPLVTAALVGSATLFALYLTNPGVDINWGTRYLVPIMPLLCVGLALLRGRWVWVGAAAATAGFIVSSPSLIAPYYRHYEVVRLEQGSPSDVYWSLDNGPAIGIWRETAEQLRVARSTDPAEFDLDEEDAGARPSSTEPFEEREALRIVFQWWWVLPIAGIPKVVGLPIVVALLLGAAWIVALTLRRHRSAPAAEAAATVPRGRMPAATREQDKP